MSEDADYMRLMRESQERERAFRAQLAAVEKERDIATVELTVSQHKEMLARENATNANLAWKEVCYNLDWRRKECDALAARVKALEAALEPSFEAAWAEKKAEGYQYGSDALENVWFGWYLAVAAIRAGAGLTKEGE